PFSLTTTPLSDLSLSSQGPPPPDSSTLSLHDALPISVCGEERPPEREIAQAIVIPIGHIENVSESVTMRGGCPPYPHPTASAVRDRKSTRLNSSHVKISYAVFCLKKKRKVPSKSTWER